MKYYDRIIIGAGMYGLYAAVKLSEKGLSVLVVDAESEPFQRGSYINQARLHNGYHYPRSYSTAAKSARYFNRFVQDYGDCVHSDLTQIYAVASEYSWTNGKQFQKFCKNLDLVCDEIIKEKYFNPLMVDKAFLTKEYTFDAKSLKEKLLQMSNKCLFALGVRIQSIEKYRDEFIFCLDNGEQYSSRFILNATYAGTNQIHKLLGYEEFAIKYELSEVIVCQVSDELKNVGLTIMDGPFFSIMPFGKTGHHTITTVARTPHVTCYESLPSFECQKKNTECSPDFLQNCNKCNFRPQSAFVEMVQIAEKYLRDEIKIEYIESLFTLKPILKASEIDDSRPTIIRKYSEQPYFYTVFSGKLNTMYDLDEIL
ncbi:MAG: FAD-dependent oxidoreductase [Desulfosporosinus sp.]|nr:FAD-dependent oxidoreductase [Desulfosporosinus sp.]